VDNAREIEELSNQLNADGVDPTLNVNPTSTNIDENAEEIVIEEILVDNKNEKGPIEELVETFFRAMPTSLIVQPPSLEGTNQDRRSNFNERTDGIGDKQIAEKIMHNDSNKPRTSLVDLRPGQVLEAINENKHFKNITNKITIKTTLNATELMFTIELVKRMTRKALTSLLDEKGVKIGEKEEVKAFIDKAHETGDYRLHRYLPHWILLHRRHDIADRSIAIL